MDDDSIPRWWPGGTPFLEPKDTQDVPTPISPLTWKEDSFENEDSEDEIDDPNELSGVDLSDSSGGDSRRDDPD